LGTGAPFARAREKRISASLPVSELRPSCLSASALPKILAAALASAGVQKDAFEIAEYSTVTQASTPTPSKQVFVGAIGSHIEISSEWGKGAISRSNFAQHPFLSPGLWRAHWQAVSASD
jgi:hypothetical protein